LIDNDRKERKKEKILYRNQLNYMYFTGKQKVYANLVIAWSAWYIAWYILFFIIIQGVSNNVNTFNGNCGETESMYMPLLDMPIKPNKYIFICRLFHTNLICRTEDLLYYFVIEHLD